MSAFYDIWISTAGIASLKQRNGNHPWEEIIDSVWLSKPIEGKAFCISINKNGFQLVLIGQLYEELAEDDLLNRYVHYINTPQTKLEDPAGHYIVFVVDEVKQDTHVFTNRLGSYHAYWSVEGVISTRYLSMAKQCQDKKLDWEGVSGFMAMGYFPDDRTYLEGISIFEPASHYRFDKQLKLVSKRRYWDWSYIPVQQTEKYYSSHIHDILQSSLTCATKDARTFIPISGGLDSRMLAGELTTDGTIDYDHLQGISYGYKSNSPEINIAKQIATARNIPMHAYVMPDYLFKELETITDAVELFQYVDGTRQASALDWFSAYGDVVVGGHWGDVWMNDMKVDSLADLSTAFEKKIIKKGSDWLLNNICAKHIDNSKGITKDYFEKFVNRYKHIDDADFVMKIYKTDQWSFRWTAASVRMYQAGAFPVLPFYDKRLVDLFTTIPTAMLRDRQLQINYLKEYHKDLAKIEWQEYGADLYTYKYFNNRNIVYRAIDKIKRTVSNEKNIQRNWEVFYMHEEGRKNLEKILLNNKLLQEIVPEANVRQLVEDLYMHPTAANGYAVSMLLTFTLFLNEVFT